MPANISDIDLYPYTYEATGRESVRHLTAQFGDNYQERRTRGINPITTTWDVTFIFVTRASTQAFVALLRDNLADHVLWRSPLDDVAQRYIVEGEWNISPRESAHIFTVRVTLRRWFGS